MDNTNITKNITNKRKNFTATFDRYDFKKAPAKICFTKVKDERGNLIKKELCLTEFEAKAYDLLGELTTGKSVIEFTAELVVDANYADGGCELIKIKDVTKK